MARKAKQVDLGASTGPAPHMEMVDREIDWQRRIASLEADLLTKEEQIGGLVSELEKLRDAIVTESDDIEQCLGQALGYPWYKDDPKNFPEATEQDGVCVGEHTAASLAAEAAETIKQLRQQLAASQAEVAALRTEHLWAKRLINCWWVAEQSLFNDVSNPEGFDKLENKTAVAIERWKESVKAAEDALATPSAAAVQWPVIAEQVEEVLDSLLCMVNQHCQIYVRDNDNVCVVLPHLSDEKEAVTLLERMGLATKNTHGSYDLRWPQNTDEVLAALDAAERVKARDATIRECLEGIIENRIADGGVCVRRVADCDCSECLARAALAALDAATVGENLTVEEVQGDGK